MARQGRQPDIQYSGSWRGVLEDIGDLRQKLSRVAVHLRPIQLDLVEGSQYDRNLEKFADALFDLLGEPSSEEQYKKLDPQ